MVAVGPHRRLELRDPRRVESRRAAEFFEHGYTIVTKVFSAGEVKRLTHAFDRLLSRCASIESTATIDGALFVKGERNGTSSLERVVWCGAAEPALLDSGRDPRLTRIASSLLGGNRLVHLINQAHFKLPGDGVDFDWHQDSERRRYGTDLWTDVNGVGSYVQVALALDPWTRSNGPLKIIPGSCAAGHIGLGAMTPEERERHIDESRAVEVLLSPGDAVFFGPYTIHGSGPNESERPRRTLINGYTLPDANRRKYPGSGTGEFFDVG